jgi:hypothetical protein
VLQRDMLIKIAWGVIAALICMALLAETLVLIFR